MNFARTILVAAVAVTTLSVSALAQEAEFQLPEQCKASPGMGDMHSNRDNPMGSAMMNMMGMGGTALNAMPEHVQENMSRMMVTMPAMHEGMMNEDPDVAFACGMIAHHQGAIDMAQVLLKHGDDPQMRTLAEEIIKTQVAEIEQMSKWLIENAN
jgi:uncharacterized protein (DUF305 family)